MNPFKQDYPNDPALEEQVHDLLAPIGTDTPDPDAASETQRMVVEAAGQPMAVRSLGFRQRLVLGAAALITPLMAVTAVGAAAGGGPVGALADAFGVTNEANQTADETPTENPTEDPTVTETPTASETPTDPTETPTEGTGEEGEDAVEGEVDEEFDPHSNGFGCDDKLWAENPDGPPFGGHDTPVGPCNEEEEEEATPTPEATAEPTEEAVEEDSGDKPDPHANGKGCDDKLFSENPDGPPFGGHDKPVGPCNGDEEADATATATTEAGTTESGGGRGQGKGNAGGKGKGKNK